MPESITDRLLEAAKQKALQKAREKAHEKLMQSEQGQKVLQFTSAAKQTMQKIQEGDIASLAKNTALKSRHVQRAMAAKNAVQQRVSNFQEFADRKNNENRKKIEYLEQSGQEHQHSGESKTAMARQAANIIAGKSRLKNTLKLAFALRKGAKEHDPTAFFLLLIVAAIKDASDIPTIGFSAPITWPLTLIIIIGLWGQGTWEMKLFLWILAGLKLIPGIAMIPTQTICVLYAWQKSEEKAKEATEKAKKLEKEAEKLQKELRMHSRRSRRRQEHDAAAA